MKKHIYQKSKLLSLIIISLTLFSARYINIDNKITDKIKTVLQSFTADNPFEKIYMHNDKALYKPGETIWFSVYLVDGESNKASDVSDVVYVDFVSPKGSVNKTLKLHALNGYCHGDFLISEKNPGGIYKIRAYTKWTKNSDPENIYEKEITVQKIIKPNMLTKLDFEKQSYAPGEKVKAEVSFQSLDNEPLSFINLDYTLSIEGKEHFSDKIKTDINGEAAIIFNLPKNLETTDVLLLVKTKHEGNTESVSRSVPITLNKIEILFFPEGGYMVNGVESRVAFTALNEFGKPADIKGKIYNDSNKEICDFESFHQGMGAFIFTPQKGETYYCRITSPEINRKYELPLAAKNGYTLNISNNYSENQLSIKYHSPAAEEITLLIVAYDKVIFSKTTKAKKGINTLKIKTDDLPIGTAKITLFDNSQIPRCERLVFLNPEKQLNINIKTDKPTYAPREKVNVHVTTTDANDVPIPARISLAVINEKIHSYADDKQHTILSGLLLGSELKGKIEEPSFYFDPEEEKAFDALDYLMLTHGWRRFVWQDIFSQSSQSNSNSTRIPEKVGTVSGKIFDKSSNLPIEGAEVFLLETDGNRIEKVITDSFGNFIFLNSNAASDLQLWVKAINIPIKNIKIKLSSGEQKGTGTNKTYVNERYISNKAIPELIIEDIIENDKFEDVLNQFQEVEEEKSINSSSMQLNMVEDVAALEEVVVVGYGSQKKSELSGSITVVNKEDISNYNISTVLQGRVPGVQVINSTERQGAPVSIKIRGTNSIITGNPLYVIDGVPVEEDININSSPLNMLSVEDVASISVIKDASAVALYGSRGSNGVIAIETKSGWYHHRRIQINTKQKYAGIKITSQGFSTVNKFYFPDYTHYQTPKEREDFRSTIYWNPNIVTNTKGEAEFFFFNSDEITTFRAIAEGISANGDIGRKEIEYAVKAPFSLDFICPAYFTYYDEVELPVILKNTTSQVIKGSLQLNSSEHLQLNQENESLMVEIPAGETKTFYFNVKVANISGKGSISIKFNSDAFKETVTKEIEVQPKGFPTKISFSGNQKEKSFTFNINKPVEGSVSSKVELYPNILSDLTNGIESMLREPHGCFEQVSSSTYPNIFILNYLQESGKSNKEIEARALGYISNGYKKLAAYETSQGGFEWYGHTPPHEGLTAYGLMEFLDMKKVFNKVDDNLIRRTEDWLLSRRDGNGGFNQHRGKYGFSGASYEVTNAYVVYALSESKSKADYDKEYETARDEALNSLDAYRLALMANTAANLNKKKDYELLLSELKNTIDKTGFEKVSANHSITRSYGNSLNLEVLSLYALSMMKKPEENRWEEITKVCNYLISKRRHGYFGSTQGTILALKALTNYAKLSNALPENGTVAIVVNGQTIEQDFSSESNSLIESENLEKYLKEGQNNVSIKFNSKEAVLPYSFNCRYTSLVPASSKDCKLELTSKLSSNSVKVGNTVRLTVQLKNIEDEGLPMSMAVVGIPAGLSMQTWQLKEIQEKRLVDYYEIQQNYLILYYKEMGPSETKEINLDLKAVCPGYYLGGASNAYLYYGAEDRYWIEGIPVTVIKD